MKFYKCALDLLKQSKIKPDVFKSNNIQGTLYRFAGLVDKEIFFVQIRENNRGNKYLISIFPKQ